MALRAPRRPGLAFVLLLLASGCDKEKEEPRAPGEAVGYEGGSSEDMIPDDGNIIEDSDHEGIARRGVHMAHMERALALAERKGLGRAGNVTAVTILPISQVDPGAHSGEVTFYRWMAEDVGEDKELVATRAHRWLSVPLLLRPDRVLENEQHNDPVEFGSDGHRRINAILLAASTARAEYPDGHWSFHTFREMVTQGRKREATTLVFLVARDEATPDLEIRIEDARRKKEASVLSTRVHHAPGKWSGDAVETQLEAPGVIAVARAVARGVEAGPLTVRTAGGSVWTVDPVSGAIQPGS